MAGITLDQANAQLTSYLAAETAVLSGQEYEITINGNRRKLKRADLDLIRDGITYWNNQVRTLNASVSGRGRSRTICPGW